MRLKVIACEVLARELYTLAGSSPQIIDLELVTKSLHDTPHLLSAEIQKRIDEVENPYDYILLGYGLCGNGLVGVKAREIPIVIPRVHDCIALVLGSNERYLQQFHNAPGTYYYFLGWLERRGEEKKSANIESTTFDLSPEWEELVKKYGEDNARYLREVMEGWRKNYKRAVFVSMGLLDEDEGKNYVKDLAKENNWEYEELKGDLRLLAHFLKGEWKEEFLLVPPGGEIAPSYDGEVLQARYPNNPSEGGQESARKA